MDKMKAKEMKESGKKTEGSSRREEQEKEKKAGK